MTFEEYLTSLQKKTVAVIGIGVSNQPLIELLLSRGVAVTACDKKDRAALGALADHLEARGAKLHLGPGYLEGLDQDVIFRTPGMRPDLPELAAAVARGSQLTSEMEVFFEVCPCQKLAVTGSDGKTTTTTIIAELLRRAGRTVHLGGNIGHPLLADTGKMRPDDIAVLELSSFQLLTHFHRDHIGGLGRVLDAVTVDRLVCTYVPPADSGSLDPDGDNGLPKAARNVLRCADMYARMLREHPGRVREFVELPGDKREFYQLTGDLSLDIICGEPVLYSKQKAVYDAAFRGERNRYELMQWGKCMNISSLRQHLHYHGKEIVLGGDAYAVVWNNDMLSPCDILKVPHHASLSSTTRKLLDGLRPRTAVVSVAARRPDERPHPYIISLLREYTEDLHFTDAVDIPGLVEPVFHESVHMEIE